MENEQKHILIVEDEAPLKQMYSWMLEDLEFKNVGNVGNYHRGDLMVHIVSAIAPAREIARSTPLIAVFLDHNLNGVTSEKIIHDIFAKTPECKIYLVWSSPDAQMDAVKRELKETKINRAHIILSKKNDLRKIFQRDIINISSRPVPKDSEPIPDKPSI